jgi:hypothetical protein
MAVRFHQTSFFSRTETSPGPAPLFIQNRQGWVRHHEPSHGSIWQLPDDLHLPELNSLFPSRRLSLCLSRLQSCPASLFAALSSIAIRQLSAVGCRREASSTSGRPAFRPWSLIVSLRAVGRRPASLLAPKHQPPSSSAKSTRRYLVQSSPLSSLHVASPHSKSPRPSCNR